MKTNVFRKVTIFLVMAICVAGCSNSFNANNENGAELKANYAEDDLFVQITKEEFDKMLDEYKGSDQVTIAKGITLKKNAESKNNDFILIFEPDAAQGTLRIAIKKGNEFYGCIFVTSELPSEGSSFLFSGSNISTLKYDFEPDAEEGDEGVSNCDKDVIISGTEYEKAPNATVHIIDTKIEGNCMKIKFSASGCDGSTWNEKLIAVASDATVYPPEWSLRLYIENREICTAVHSKEVSFNIKELQLPGNKVRLNISGKSILYEY